MTENKSHITLMKLLPLILLGLGLVTFLALDGGRYFTFQNLSDHREQLLEFVETNWWVAAGIFMGIYAVSVAFSLPGATILTLSGGFLFGIVFGAIFTVFAATLGAMFVFLAARMGLGDPLRRRAGPFLKSIEAGFQRNAVSYLLILRLVPIFPFWLVNLAPAFLGINLFLFTWTTGLGIIPGTVVFVSVGNGLGSLFDRGDVPDLGIIFEPQILLPLLGLAALSLLPVLYNHLKSEKEENSSGSQ